MGRFSQRARIGLLLLALTAAGFVSPLSYVPNPVGLYYVISGEYRYNPQSHFVNRFATLGARDPTEKLAPQLDQLLGQTGLDPLDPVQPLAAYRVRQVINRPGGAVVEFQYADGSSRTHTIPVFEQIDRTQGRGGWRYTGLDRVLTRHEQLLNLPPAGAQSPTRLAAPRRLALHPEVGRLAAAPFTFYSSPYWSWGGLPQTAEDLRLAPDGKGFLLLRAESMAAGTATLWLIPLDGSPPRQLAERVRRAVWSGDGRFVFALQEECWQLQGHEGTLKAIDSRTGDATALDRTPARYFGVAGADVFFLRAGALWRVRPDGRPAERLRALSDVDPVDSAPIELAVAPDGRRLAYRCGGDLCLADVAGDGLTRLPVSKPAQPWHDSEYCGSVRFGLAWNHDGTQLAATDGDLCSDRWPELRLIDRDGQVQRHLFVGPNGMTREPQWAPEGHVVVLNTFP